MSETRAVYGVSGLEEGPNPATLLPFSDPGYVAPTEQDLRLVMQRFGLTGSQVASLTGMQPRNVRKMTAPADASSHIDIKYSAWRILLIACGIVEPETITDLPARAGRGRPRLAGMRIAFESGARFITVYNPDGTMKVSCSIELTDCTESESLDDFVTRHGGPEQTAHYLAERFNTGRVDV